MLDFKRIKNLINPLNAIITGIIILFVFSRVLSNNQENAFVIEEITKIELQTEQQTEQQTTQSAENAVNSATISPKVQDSNDDLLAYSAELDKTFTLDAFNKLSKEDLMTFAGIGEVTAQAILDYRRDNGPFGHFDDLMLVKGIGEKKLQKIMKILP